MAVERTPLLVLLRSVLHDAALNDSRFFLWFTLLTGGTSSATFHCQGSSYQLSTNRKGNFQICLTSREIPVVTSSSHVTMFQYKVWDAMRSLCAA